jgi:hypothetical protein
MERRVLLADSGELGSWGRFWLTRHLATCAACRAFQADLQMTRKALLDMPVSTLSNDRRAALLDAARPDRRDVVLLAPTVHPIAWWRPALAAAALAIVLGASLYMRSGSGEPPPVLAGTNTSPDAAEIASGVEAAVDAEIDALQALLLASLNDSTDTSAQTSVDEDTLARELLALQETTL